MEDKKLQVQRLVSMQSSYWEAISLLMGFQSLKTCSLSNEPPRGKTINMVSDKV